VAQRTAVRAIQAKFKLSERRACVLVGLGRSTCRYRPRRQEWPGLRDRLRALAGERRRFGYRRLHVLLRREGFAMNIKRVYRLYTQERLTVRRRRRRRRAPRGVPWLTPPTRVNERWSLDFVLDVLEDGRRFRILTVVDDFTRACLAIDVDTSIGGRRVAEVLQRGGLHLLGEPQGRGGIAQADGPLPGHEAIHGSGDSPGAPARIHPHRPSMHGDLGRVQGLEPVAGEGPDEGSDREIGAMRVADQVELGLGQEPGGVMELDGHPALGSQRGYEGRHRPIEVHRMGHAVIGDHEVHRLGRRSGGLNQRHAPTAKSRCDTPPAPRGLHHDAAGLQAEPGHRLVGPGRVVRGDHG